MTETVPGEELIPTHPQQFVLKSMPVPLAGLSDTYWMARADWMDTQKTYEGFLIYADTQQYLFLDSVEAETVLAVLHQALRTEEAA